MGINEERHAQRTAQTERRADQSTIHSEGYPNMFDGKPEYVLKKCKELCNTFSQRWYPKEMIPCYMSTFSHQQWEKLSTSQKLHHSRQECRTCPVTFPDLTHAFPCKKQALSERQLVDVTVTEPDVCHLPR